MHHITHTRREEEVPYTVSLILHRTITLHCTCTASLCTSTSHTEYNRASFIFLISFLLLHTHAHLLSPLHTQHSHTTGACVSAVVSLVCARAHACLYFAADDGERGDTRSTQHTHMHSACESVWPFLLAAAPWLLCVEPQGTSTHTALTRILSFLPLLFCSLFLSLTHTERDRDK